MAEQHIDTGLFIERMRDHWTERLGNVSSRELEIAWEQLSEAFKKNILSHDDPAWRDEWIVVQPPTGSGKTQGTILYSAMLSPEVESHPGVLIITRLKEEADTVAREVNELAGEDVALAHHSDSGTRFGELSQWPVLVITHRAYELALDYLGRDGSVQDTFQFFHSFDSFKGRRKLVVVDECLDIVEHHQVDQAGIKQVINAIEKLSEKFPQEYDMLKWLDSHMQTQEVGREINPDAFRGERMVQPDYHNLDFSSLRSAIWAKDIKWDREVLGKCSPDVRQDIQRRVDRVLKALEHMAKEFTYYANHNGKHTWNTARLLVPEDVKGAVVLDATANVNTIYDLFDKAVVWTPPQGVRNYQNVTLYVSVGHKVGKESMTQQAQNLCKSLLGDLEGRFTGQDDKALIVTHKDVEPVMMSYSPKFQMETGHWGALQGRNIWKDCNHIVLFGMPYKPSVVSMTTYQAFKGPIPPEVAMDDEKARMDKAREQLKTGWLITDILQAFNRIQCRKVIDAEGNCPEAEGYILFKSKEEAEKVLPVIEREMPGINIDRSWELETGKKRVKKSDAEQALAQYLKVMEPGRQSKSEVMKYLGVSQAKMTALVQKAWDPETTVGQVMVEAGVSLKQKKKGQAVYFDKPN